VIRYVIVSFANGILFAGLAYTLFTGLGETLALGILYGLTLRPAT